MSNKYHTLMADGSIIDTRTGKTIKPADKPPVIKEKPVFKKGSFPEDFTSNVDQGIQLNMIPTVSQMEAVGLGTSREERKQYKWTGKTYQHVDDIDSKYFINPKTDQPFPGYGIPEQKIIPALDKVTTPIVEATKPIDQLFESAGLNEIPRFFLKNSATAGKFLWNKTPGIKPAVTWSLEQYDRAVLGYSQQFNMAPWITESLLTGVEAFGPGVVNKARKGGPLVRETLEQVFTPSPNLALATADSTVFTKGSNSDNAIKSYFEYSSEVKSKAMQTGDTGRIGKAVVQSPDIPGSAYRKASLYTDAKGTLRKGTPTSTIHHVGGLDENGRAIIEHFSWDKIPTDGVSPIVEKLDSWGIKLGNNRENLTDIFDIYTIGGRRQQVRSIYQQLDGILPESVINDLLGGSNLNLKDLPTGKVLELEAYKKAGIPVPPSFWDGVPKDVYPWIELKPKGWKKGQPFEKWRPANIDEFKNRFKISAEKMGIDYKGFDWKKIRIDPKSITLSPDHKNVHALIDKAKVTKGNPLYEIEEMLNSGKFKDLSVEEASKMLANSQVYQEKLLANVLSKRYKAIEKWYDALPVEKRGGPGLNRTWKDLGPEAKRKIVQENSAQLGALGGLNQDIKLDKIVDITWDEGITHIFGWKPQTLNIPKKTNKRSQVKAIKRDINKGL